MSSSGWESTDLLARFNQLAGRPPADAIPDTTKYQYLADGEQTTITRIASIVPKVLYGAPRALTTADGGLTFTFGTDDNGYALVPMGRVTIYPSLSAIPGGAWVPGVDYLDEGVRIRRPNGVAYTGTLYWYGITPSQQMSATVQPVLMPPPARMLSVIKAVEHFAEAGTVRNAVLADRMGLRYERDLVAHVTAMRKQFASGGAMGRLLWPLGGAGSPSA